MLSYNKIEIKTNILVKEGTVENDNRTCLTCKMREKAKCKVDGRKVTRFTKCEKWVYDDPYQW